MWICNTGKHYIQNCWFNAKNANSKLKIYFQGNIGERNFEFNGTGVQSGFGYLTAVNKFQPSFGQNYVPYNKKSYGNYDVFQRNNGNGDYNCSEQYFLIKILNPSVTESTLADVIILSQISVNFTGTVELWEKQKWACATK